MSHDPRRVFIKRAPLASTTLALALCAIALPSTAHAFCRTWSCDPTKEECPPDPSNPKCGGGVAGKHHPLFWPVPCIGFSLQQNATIQLPGATREERYAIFDQIANSAFATWQNVRCDGELGPSVQFSNLGPVACDRHEYNSS